RLAALIQPEIRLLAAIAADLDAAGELLRHHMQEADAERFECRIVERLRTIPVGNGYAGVVDHGRRSSRSAMVEVITMCSQTLSMSRSTSSFQKRRTVQPSRRNVSERRASYSVLSS